MCQADEEVDVRAARVKLQKKLSDAFGTLCNRAKEVERNNPGVNTLAIGLSKFSNTLSCGFFGEIFDDTAFKDDVLQFIQKWLFDHCDTKVRCPSTLADCEYKERVQLVTELRNEGVISRVGFNAALDLFKERAAAKTGKQARAQPNKHTAAGAQVAAGDAAGPSTVAGSTAGAVECSAPNASERGDGGAGVAPDASSNEDSKPWLPRADADKKEVEDFVERAGQHWLSKPGEVARGNLPGLSKAGGMQVQHRLPQWVHSHPQPESQLVKFMRDVRLAWKAL